MFFDVAGDGPVVGPLCRSLARVGLALGLFGAAGCGDGDGAARGVLVVPYELGNNRSCEALGVDVVQAQLDDGFLVEEVACSEGQVRIDGVPVGDYDVLLYGLDADGFPVLDSEAAGPAKARVFDSATTTVEPAVLLTSAPARLYVRWSFDFGSCEADGVDHFLVRAWHVDGTELLLEYELPCTTPGEGSGRYRQVPDPDRELAGDVLGEVSVQPVDTAGKHLGEAAVFVFDSPGPGHPIRLTLTGCSSSGCDATGIPD